MDATKLDVMNIEDFFNLFNSFARQTCSDCSLERKAVFVHDCLIHENVNCDLNKLSCHYVKFNCIRCLRRKRTDFVQTDYWVDIDSFLTPVKEVDLDFLEMMIELS